MRVGTLETLIAEGWLQSPDHPNIIVRYPNARHPLGGKVFYCNDCRVLHPEPYMLENAVWRSVVSEHKCFLCLRCISDRLGRPLVFEDFTNAKINSGIFFGYQMAMNRRNSTEQIPCDSLRT